MNITKIICTYGPACSSIPVLKKMLKNGMSVIRFNMSHTDPETAFKNIKNIKDRFNDSVGIALDTKGPEIRISWPKDNVRIEKDDKLSFYYVANKKSQNKCENKIFIIDQKLGDVEENSIVQIDDGLLQLRVTFSDEEMFEAVALNSHFLPPGKKVSISGCKILGNPIGEEIKKLVILEDHIDYIFLSFVNSAEDIACARKYFKSNTPLIYAKIESREAIKNIREIVEAADGIMIARGDLMVEVGIENLFSTQKKIIQICNSMGKPVIMATQMLESMVKTNIPTRAEVCDIGNAVMEGCECVMLSAESATGSNPETAVSVMKSVCKDAEGLFRVNNYFGVSVIVILTDDIKEVLDWKKYKIPCIVVTTSKKLATKLHIMRCITPFVVSKTSTFDDNHLIDYIKCNFKFQNCRVLFKTQKNSENYFIKNYRQ